MSFRACNPVYVRKCLVETLVFQRLPVAAEADAIAAIDRVSSESQQLMIQAAEDARLEHGVALDRLACLWALAAAVNLADDLADGDGHYLPPRVAPGVAFLLQALAGVLAARSHVSASCMEEVSGALVQAASGQSLEVRARHWSAENYLQVAKLIAGKQYAAYLRMLWDGTPWQAQAFAVGMNMGWVGLVVTDIQSEDVRFTSQSRADQRRVLESCDTALLELGTSTLLSVTRFHEFASTLLGSYFPGSLKFAS